MHVIKKKTLAEFWVKHADSKNSLNAWFHEAKVARWETPQDIKLRYRTADFLPENRVVFNIGGNKYRLVVAVRYDLGIVFVRFVGTHSQYDRIKVEEV